MENKADLFQPIHASHLGPAPIVVRAIVNTNNNYIVGGVPEVQLKNESYVLVSALPRELQERIRTAVQAIVSGM